MSAAAPLDLADKVVGLVVTANRHHENAERHAVSALEDIIDAGRAIWELRRHVEPGTWEQFSRENLTMSGTMINKYQRIYYHRDAVRASGATGVISAIAALAGKAPFTQIGRPQKELPIEEIERLNREEKLTPQTISGLIGVSASTIRRRLDPSLTTRDLEQHKEAREPRPQRRKWTSERSSRTEIEIAADTVVALMAAGCVAKTPAAIRDACIATGIGVADLKQGWWRREAGRHQPPTLRLVESELT